MDSDRLALFSLFVDNLPEDVGLNWFRKFFSQYGVVKDAYIPFKRSKVSRRRFGFVRFNCSSSAEVAISKANGFWIDNRKLFVKMAAFEARGLKPGHNGEKHDLLLSSTSVDLLMNNGSKIPEKSRGLHEDRPSYAQVTRGVEGIGENLATRSVRCHAIGNGWLYRSAIAKIRKLVSAKDLECIFNLEKVTEVQIKAIGGRYVIITFANEGMRDKILKEHWVKNWFSDFHPWSGEQAKEERFVWISCFGMPLSAWSSQTFKDIGSIWGEFIEVDDNTLKGGSYEKGRILIATDHSKRIEENIELVEDGRKYIVRIEEESSFRKVESSNFLPDFDALSVHDVKLSQVPKEALSLDLGSKVDPNDNGFGSSLGLESLVEDSMGLQSLFHEAFVVEPAVKTRSQGKFLDVNSGDSFSSAKVASEGSDYDDRDLISNEPLIQFVEHKRHKKSHKAKKANHGHTAWSKNPLKTTMCSRTDSRDNFMINSRMGSKIGSVDGSVDGSIEGPTHSFQEEASSDICQRNSILVKEARENMKMSVRLGVKFHGRESFNIKKVLELKGVEISEQEINAEIKALDNLEGDTSISMEF